MTGHYVVALDTPRGIQPYQPGFEVEPETGPPIKMLPGKPWPRTEVTTTPRVKPSNIEVRRNVFDRTGKNVTPAAKEKRAEGEEVTTNGEASTAADTKALEEIVREPRKPVYCASCAIDTTRLYYHKPATGPNGLTSAAGNEAVDMCPSCFLAGRYSTNSQRSDFVKVPEEEIYKQFSRKEDPGYTSVRDRDAPWTEDETLRLLEALNENDEDWDAVASRVDTRTREECVMKFLQLEIEDEYLDEQKHERNGMAALNYGHVPFSNAGNPIMGVISFLASMADPAVSAAAAGRSVQAMKDSLRQQLNKPTGASTEAPEESDTTATEPTAAPVKNEDSMDVDGAEPTTSASIDATTKISPSNTLPAPELAMATSAARAFALASHEEREMTRLVAVAVNITLEKHELKLKQFAEMEAALQAERLELERGRRQLFLDRLAFKKRVSEVQDTLRKMNLPDGGKGLLQPEERLGFASVTGRMEQDLKGEAGGMPEGERTLEL